MALEQTCASPHDADAFAQYSKPAYLGAREASLAAVTVAKEDFWQCVIPVQTSDNRKHCLRPSSRMRVCALLNRARAGQACAPASAARRRRGPRRVRRGHVERAGERVGAEQRLELAALAGGQHGAQAVQHPGRQRAVQQQAVRPMRRAAGRRHVHGLGQLRQRGAGALSQRSQAEKTFEFLCHSKRSSEAGGGVGGRAGRLRVMRCVGTTALSGLHAALSLMQVSADAQGRARRTCGVRRCSAACSKGTGASSVGTSQPSAPAPAPSPAGASACSQSPRPATATAPSNASSERGVPSTAPPAPGACPDGELTTHASGHSSKACTMTGARIRKCG